jgi:DNA-binding CsgD family transcriptional regulator
MSQQENPISDSRFSKWIEDSTAVHDDLEVVLPSAARARALGEAGAELARQLNGPRTALLLYIGEIKQHSQQLSPSGNNRVYLQQVVENALQQTEQVCALVKQMAGRQEKPADPTGGKAAREARRGRDGNRSPAVMLSSGSDQKPLTRREREVLSLVREGCSNKQGALQLKISPRTFESHRAEVMRKLGARNTADLVRLALLHSV